MISADNTGQLTHRSGSNLHIEVFGQKCCDIQFRQPLLVFMRFEKIKKMSGYHVITVLKYCLIIWRPCGWTLEQLDLNNHSVQAHEICNQKRKKYYLIYICITVTFVWQMCGSILLDPFQNFTTISSDWWLNVTGLKTAGRDVDAQSILLDPLPVVL